MPISEIVEHFPYLGLFILLVLGVIGLPFPEDTTLILCGFLIAQAVIKPVPALMVVYSGILIADYFLYIVGKKYGRAVITRKGIKKFLTPERMSVLEEKFRKRGVVVILLGRHIVGLRAQLFIVAGIMRMSTIKFLVADAFSAIFTIILMVGAGYIGGYSLKVVETDIKRVEHLAVLLIIILLTIYITVRYMKMRQNDEKGR